jgi:hypothetical protein
MLLIKLFNRTNRKIPILARLSKRKPLNGQKPLTHNLIWRRRHSTPQSYKKKSLKKKMSRRLKSSLEMHLVR